MRIRRAIVISLEWLCGVLDRLPAVRRYDGEWEISWWNGGLGCYPLNLAARSSELDLKWGTGVWTSVEVWTSE